MKYTLRTKPTQFTKGKTEETLCDITKRYLLNNTDEDSHLIDIIVTNNSLPETEQWKCRAHDKFKDNKTITIDILSSKNKADYNDIRTYINKILMCNNKSELPNILIICYHTKRVCDDLINMFKIFGNKKFIQINSNIKFHVSFDEPDANIGVTSRFIQKIKPFIDSNTIIGILFITATPVEEFWKMLEKSSITKLLNINYGTIQEFKDNFDNYRSFKSHKIIEHNNNTNNPLYYIIDVYSSKLIENNKRNIIFAPGHMYTEKEGVGSHTEIISYFNDKKYVVFLMNGKFKGFIYPDKTRVELTEFNSTYDIKGELRNSLKKWCETNPNTNLAITGYWVIERGVTFNTDGFNFTYMILSNYHLSSQNKLVQLSGRGTGGKKYVNKMNVICTTAVKNSIVDFNNNLEKICSLNPEYFNRTDFINKNNIIPVKVVFRDISILNELIKIRNTSKKYKTEFHKAIIKGIDDKRIELFDNNNIHKLSITTRKLNTVRVYEIKHSVEVRRFKNFSVAFENNKGVTQSCKECEYNIDLAKDNYVNGDFTNNRNTAWITFKY